MFGALRFILAFAVALEHSRLPRGVHLGPFAVSFFYLLSGYVMAGFFRKRFGNQLKRAGEFYLDRALRIYPLYLLISLLCVGFIGVTGRELLHLSPTNAVATVLLFPLTFFSVAPSLFMVNHNSFPLPPAPSLALELQFYLLLPIFCVFPSLRRALFALSLGLFASACYLNLNTYYYSFLVFPTRLFLFLGGSLLCDYRDGIEVPRNRDWLFSAMIFSLVLLLACALGPQIAIAEIPQTILALLLGIPTLALLSQNSAKNKWDLYLGSLSYPLFVVHPFVIWLSNYLVYLFTPKVSAAGMAVFELFTAVCLAVVFEWAIERPVQAFRKRGADLTQFVPLTA